MIKPCPFCGSAPYEHVEDGAIGSKQTLVSCPNANCPASCIHTCEDTWNCRAPNKEHKELAIELHDLKHAIREAMVRIESEKLDLSQSASPHEIFSPNAPSVTWILSNNVARDFYD